MDTLFIFGAKYLFVLSFIIAGVYFLRVDMESKKRLVIFTIPTLFLIYALSLIASHLYFDPRPFVVQNFKPLIPHAPDNGFPSDHVLLVSSISSIFLYVNRRIASVLWLITILVAICRVYVGVHHSVDVIGSILLSLLGTGIVYLLIQKYAKNKELLQ